MKPSVQIPSKVFVGTSGWHYNHWLGLFYPQDIKGYNELRYHTQHFDTVENNSSFYRVAHANTYKTWDRMTPDGYKISMKMNKMVTHNERLELSTEECDTLRYVLESTQVLGAKRGALVIQLPPSFRMDLARLEQFLRFFIPLCSDQADPFDIAIEFRNASWFDDEVYSLLRQFNVSLVASQSSRYPAARIETADFVYVRMHGPEKLFASSYNTEQLREWADYIAGLPPAIQRVYVYFNNDFFGYALDNAKQLIAILEDKQALSFSGIQG